MDIQLKSLMNDYVADYMQKEPFDFVVKNALPVIWFGNLEKYKASKTKNRYGRHKSKQSGVSFWHKTTL